jgi:hypothetical protein
MTNDTDERPATKAPGGRPKNVNERQLEEALAPILDRLNLIEAGQMPDGEPTTEGVAAPLSRGHFFMHLLAGMCIHRGEAAFNPQFLDTVRNNADDFYEAYCQITRGTHEVQQTTRQILAETEARLSLLDREKQDLKDRLAEMEEEQRILTAQASDGGGDEVQDG